MRPAKDGTEVRTIEEHGAAALALCAPVPQESVPLAAAHGLVLAAAVHADEPLPRWDCSAMDGFAVRAGTPRAIIDRLQQETAKAVAVPEIKERMFGLGIEPVASTPGAFAAHIKAERDKWIPLFVKIGIKPQ